MKCFAWMLVASLPLLSASDEVPKAPQVSQTTNPGNPLAPIREFDLETLARFGREIYRQDQLAWMATDVVAEKIGFDRLVDEGACGWVVDTSGSVPFVRFLRRTAGNLEAACDVYFPEGANPSLVIPKDRTLTPRQATSFEARESSKKRFARGDYPLCQVANGSYNTVVLDDPAGKGFLVYWLRPKETMTQVPVGGHYRVSVSEDGKTVTRVDRLFATCLTLDTPKNTFKDDKAKGLFVSHVVSSTPVETHVFVALQEKLPLYVGTPDRKLWLVQDGRIQYLETLPEETGEVKSRPTEKK